MRWQQELPAHRAARKRCAAVMRGARVRIAQITSVCAVLEIAGGCQADEVSSNADATENQSTVTYRDGPRTRDGIGKYYRGREIAQVMGHLGAGWLERPAREREERTDLLLDLLPLTDSSVVADIGAGTGYFALPIARRVPQGRVLAVDIQPQMLAIIKARQAQAGIENIERILSSESDPALPANTVDLVLIVDAYHEFSYPMEMTQGIVAGLKPGGKLVLIEYRGEDEAVPIKRLHKMTEAQARAEIEAVGLRWVRTDDALPQQHFMVFEKPTTDGLLH
ncbi:MAG: class I SAM-dependent methyltransferase [Pseudomonadota bacterium]